MFTDEQIEEVRPAVEEFHGRTRADWYAEACRMEPGANGEAMVWACRYRELSRESARLLEGFVDSVKLAVSMLYEMPDDTRPGDVLNHLRGANTHPFEGRAYQTRDIDPDSTDLYEPDQGEPVASHLEPAGADVKGPAYHGQQS
jgi:hypothetical protein